MHMIVRKLCRSLLKAPSFACTKSDIRWHSSNGRAFPPGFTFWPAFLSIAEQRTLLAASLYKLDMSETRHMRRRRNDFWKSRLGKASHLDVAPLEDLFAPENLYEFQEGHYDGVIHYYRETHLSSWPVETFDGLQPVLKRLHSLCPTRDLQTHLLHLSSYGHIDLHIDNVNSSGSWILGVSLGDERILQMKKVDDDVEYRLNLPSGSVYLQKDEVRYNYLHAIESSVEPHKGQRLSIMIRDPNMAPSSARLSSAI